MMEADKTWTEDEQKFHFAACGATQIANVGEKQLAKAGTAWRNGRLPADGLAQERPESTSNGDTRVRTSYLGRIDSR